MFDRRVIRLINNTICLIKKVIQYYITLIFFTTFELRGQRALPQALFFSDSGRILHVERIFIKKMYFL